MSKFMDREGREWEIEFDVDVLISVRKETGFEFGKCFQDEGVKLWEMLDDMERISEVAYVICKQQCADQKVTQQSFRKSIVGDGFDDLQKAILEALSVFCPSQYRTSILAVLATMKKMPEVAKQTAEELETYLKSASKPEQSSESIQESTPIGS